MRWGPVFALLLVARIAVAEPAVADQWLMLVRTENTDPAQEAAFNHWYDDIDIPDVLRVPGYLRARRGVASGDAPNQGSGRYIALYDIRSTDIERTIAAMNQLALDMPKQGRATPLLEVTERIYYRLYRAPREGTPSASPQPGFLVLARFAPPAAQSPADFDANYDAAVLGPALARPGVQRATRYQLHRVRMDEPIEVPRFLTVFEIAAPDPQQARALVETGAAVGERPDLIVFRQINDVARTAP